MLDPISIEILQNRLVQICYEGGYALIRTAASPGIVHVKDLGFNISDHLGRSLVYSTWMPRHGTTLGYMLRSCEAKFRGRIYPGDMYITNDPHAGALHNLDIAVIAPVHYNDELIAWTGCATHHLDIGAATPGRSPLATEYFEEGLIIPPLKLVERGELNEDFFDLFLQNVRVPDYQGLDLKGQIAANNVARVKIQELARNYGVQTLKTSYDEIIAFSEAKARAIVGNLAPGRYEAVDYLDYGRVYTIKCALTIEGSNLTFDFAGTDAQADNFINCALPCTVANVHNIVICMLFADVSINEGCLRPITVLAPERSIVACRPPAPCSGASVTSGHKVMSLTIKTLSQALARSSDWWRANASWVSGIADLLLRGVDRENRPFFTRMFTASMPIGAGARANKDGIDYGCPPGSTTTSRPNIEDTEERCPVLHLYSMARADSAGPGKFRGGVGHVAAFKLHGAEQAEALFWYVGKEIAPDGFMGGRRGTTNVMKRKTNTNVNELLRVKVPSFEELEGDETELPGQCPPFAVTEKDVILFASGGGGGYGNPLERDPELVRKDVVEGYVSVERAKEDYGVLMVPGSLEAAP